MVRKHDEKRETWMNIRAARKLRGLSRKTLTTLVLGLVTVGIVGGFAFASVLSLTGVTGPQSTGAYSTTGAALANFPTAPTLVATVSPSSTCQGPTYTFNTQGASGTQAILVGLNGTCHSGDFAYEWLYAPAASMVVQSDNFTLDASWTIGGYATSGSFTVDVTVSPAGPPNSAHFGIIVDFGVGVPTTVSTLQVIAT